MSCQVQRRSIPGRMTYFLPIHTVLLSILLQVSFQPLIHASSDTDSLLRYPVIVAPGAIFSRTASGVFLGSSTTTYLVTARHVLVSDTKALVKPFALVRGNATDPYEDRGYMLELDLDALQRSGNWKEDLEHDVLVVRFMWDSKLMEGVQLRYEPPSGPATVPFPSVLPLHDIALQKTVYLAGYRVSTIPRGAETSELNIPKIREGKTLLKEEQKGQIVSDYLAVGGDSGAPVFMFSRGGAVKLVGIHIGRQDCITPEGPLKCAIATPMDFIFALISTFK
jgi:trypsin-like peptidase